MHTLNQWTLPPADLSLGDHDLHVWRIDLSQSVECEAKLRTTLSPDEQARADRFRFERDRRRYIVGRGALRSILGRYLGCSSPSITFEYEERGKPRLAAQHASTLQFNVSHSNEVAVCAVTRQAVGVDVEYTGRVVADADRLALRFFSINENAVFGTLPIEKQRAAFFRCWTRKEAFIKTSGAGLSYPLDRFDVTLAPDLPPAFLSIDGDVSVAQRWALYHLEPAAAYVGAVAIEGRDWKLAGLIWPAEC